MRNECGLQGMQHVVSGETFNRGDVPAFILRASARHEMMRSPLTRPFMPRRRLGCSLSLFRSDVMIAEGVEKTDTWIDRQVVHGTAFTGGQRVS